MSTGLTSWSNPSEIGGLYPFGGWEVLFVLVATVLWLLWLLWSALSFWRGVNSFGSAMRCSNVCSPSSSRSNRWAIRASKGTSFSCCS
jgi:hypothetical protein